MNGLVLAGGKGRRMGRDKGSMVHPDGRMMVRRAAELLKEAGCERVVVALREGQGFPGEYEVVRDSGEGALGGMISGMETAEGEDWLIVACDLPGMEVGVLRGLLGFAEDFVVYGRNGMLEPLCGFYGNGTLELLKKSRKAGEWSLQKILRANGVKVLEIEDGRALDNANTPDDWERFSQSFRKPDR